MHEDKEECTKNLLSKNLVHFEHAEPVDLEYSLHAIITDNFPSILGILQVVSLDIDPKVLDDLRTGHSLGLQELCKGGTKARVNTTNSDLNGPRKGST